MALTLNIPEEQMKEFVSEAILRTIDDKTRDTLIAEAMRYLLTKESNRGYGTGRSPLQEAFDYALINVARELVRDMLTADEKVMGALRAVIVTATEKALVVKRDETIDNITNAIVKSFRVE